VTDYAARRSALRSRCQASRSASGSRPGSRGAHGDEGARRPISRGRARASAAASSFGPRRQADSACTAARTARVDAVQDLPSRSHAAATTTRRFRRSRLAAGAGSKNFGVCAPCPGACIGRRPPGATKRSGRPSGRLPRAAGSLAATRSAPARGVDGHCPMRLPDPRRRSSRPTAARPPFIQLSVTTKRHGDRQRQKPKSVTRASWRHHNFGGSGN